MSELSSPSMAELTGNSNYFEDFPVGRKIRHSRGATIGEVENNYVTKQVMNTAQGHWNEHRMAGSALGDGRLVFGLVTCSMVVGLTSQDTAENALTELGLDSVRFIAPVHHGDTIYAYSEVISSHPAEDNLGAGVVCFQHWGVNQHSAIVCEMQRTVLIKRRAHWGHSS